MEFFLRWGLVAIGLFVLLLIFYDVWFRRVKRYENKAELAEVIAATEPYLKKSMSTMSSDEDEEEILEPKLVAETPEIQEESFSETIENEVQQDEEIIKEEPTAKPRSPLRSEDILVLSVLAKPSCTFASYDLFQAIAATGMQYGDMDIFHYYEPAQSEQVHLFSLASATKPGTFDLDRMGDFSCAGLSLFMDKSNVPNSEEAFFTMLQKAEQLADDLDGELYFGPKRQPWNHEVMEQVLNTF